MSVMAGRESISNFTHAILGNFINFTFADSHHSLLCDDVLVAILFPLIGGEELSDSDYEQLPIELQYIDEAKQRHPLPSVRLKLLEILHQVL